MKERLENDIPLTFTPEAARYVLEYMTKEGQLPPLRVFIRSAQNGCGTSEIAFASNTFVEAGDTQHEAYGLSYVVNYLEFPELRGGRIELVDGGISGRQLRFIPSSTEIATCGCGKAFSLKRHRGNNDES